MVHAAFAWGDNSKRHVEVAAIAPDAGDLEGNGGDEVARRMHGGPSARLPPEPLRELEVDVVATVAEIADRGEALLGDGWEGVLLQSGRVAVGVKLLVVIADRCRVVVYPCIRSAKAVLTVQRLGATPLPDAARARPARPV
jgi:hypothetical protein